MTVSGRDPPVIGHHGRLVYEPPGDLIPAPPVRHPGVKQNQTGPAHVDLHADETVGPYRRQAIVDVHANRPGALVKVAPAKGDGGGRREKEPPHTGAALNVPC